MGAGLNPQDQSRASEKLYAVARKQQTESMRRQLEGLYRESSLGTNILRVSLAPVASEFPQ